MTTRPRARRRRFAPTDRMRSQVRTLAAFGIPSDHICGLVLDPALDRPITPTLLRRHFAKELADGASMATSDVFKTLHRLAVGAPAEYDRKGRLIRAQQPALVTATIFWVKTFGGLEALAKPPRKPPDALAPPPFDDSAEVACDV